MIIDSPFFSENLNFLCLIFEDLEKPTCDFDPLSFDKINISEIDPESIRHELRSLMSQMSQIELERVSYINLQERFNFIFSYYSIKPKKNYLNFLLLIIYLK